MGVTPPPGLTRLDCIYKDKPIVSPSKQDEKVVETKAKHKTATNGLSAYNLTLTGLAKKLLPH